MNNPMYDLWLSVQGKAQEEKVAAKFHSEVNYAWAVPGPEAIAAIVNSGPIIEINAGAGYWASMVEQAGGDIIATDLNPIQTHPEAWLGDIKPFTDVYEAEASIAAEYPERTLLTVWPLPDQEYTTRAVTRYINAGGKRVIYVGEVNGCTGSSMLWKLLGLTNSCPKHTMKRSWEHCSCNMPTRFKLAETVWVPNWPLCHDSMFICDLITEEDYK